MFSDYHLHSEFSFDSREKIENICALAVQQNIKEIVFTDHVEFPETEAYTWPDYEKRSEVISECRRCFGESLSILTGVELGGAWRDITGAELLIKQQRFDYVLGTVHFPDNVPEAKDYPFDEENVRSYYDNYLYQMKVMAEKCDYDCVAHATYLFRFIPENLLQICNPYLYKKDYLELFDIIASRKKGIEVNTSGLRMPTVRETLPSAEILSWFKYCGGKTVTVGSDGHSCRNAFSGLTEGFDVLRKAGYDSVAHYHQREVSYTKI